MVTSGLGSGGMRRNKAITRPVRTFMFGPMAPHRNLGKCVAFTAGADSFDVTQITTPMLPEETQKEDAKETFKESKEAALNLAYILIPSIPLLLLLVVTAVVCWVWIYRRRKREQPDPSTKEPHAIWPSPHQENSPDLEVYNVIRKQSEADLAEPRPDLKNISFRVCSGDSTPEDVSCDYENMAVNPSESGFVTLASVESGFVTNDIYEFSPDRMGRSKESGWVENDIYAS
uniref:layilin isoform X4 n=1 Tax=Jaculus jaculus TaxID=51337 RepID=UPI001E1B48D0|nr:layilin isoform X4 [Jaculus jaculus]